VNDPLLLIYYWNWWPYCDIVIVIIIIIVDIGDVGIVLLLLLYLLYCGNYCWIVADDDAGRRLTLIVGWEDRRYWDEDWRYCCGMTMLVISIVPEAVIELMILALLWLLVIVLLMWWCVMMLPLLIVMRHYCLLLRMCIEVWLEMNGGVLV